MNRNALCAVALAIANTLSGCAQLQDHEKESAKSSIVTPIPQSWWYEFNDTELNNLINTALEMNLSIKSTEARLLSYQYQLLSSESKLYPELGGTFNQNFQRGNLENRHSIDESKIGKIGLDARWDIDLFGKLKLSSKSQEYTYLENEQRLEQAKLILVSELSKNWYNLIEERTKESIITNQLLNSNKILKVGKQRYSMGLGSISTVLRQEQLINDLKSDLLDSKKEQRVITKKINVLLGREPDKLLSVNRLSMPTIESISDEGIEASILENHPAVKTAWYRYQSKSYLAKSMDKNRLPNIVITSDASKTSRDWNESFEIWKVGLGVKIDVPLFDMGRRNSDYKQHKALEEQALHEYTESILETMLNVEMALIQEQTQGEQLKITKSQINKAQRVLDIELTKYSQGNLPFIDVLNAQEKLLRLQQREIEEHSQLIKRRITLYQSIGAGLKSS
ncbi:RND transporter [Vibrio alfacsensis]|uniref:TolC family protein n=1 Tax=Vibrio alfacsensis TaxID=1074311 RepID=UPI001BEEE99D|nr:TolC family protein [Vibrio alfacsensis]BBM67504.1 RND transporter [Vibrio alfacsensis]